MYRVQNFDLYRICAASNFKIPNIRIYFCYVLLGIFYSFTRPVESQTGSSDNKCTRVEQYEVQIPVSVVEPVVVERTKFCFKNRHFRCKVQKVEYHTRIVNRTEMRNRTIVECCPGYELVNEECVLPDPCKNVACLEDEENDYEVTTVLLVSSDDYDNVEALTTTTTTSVQSSMSSPSSSSWIKQQQQQQTLLTTETPLTTETLLTTETPLTTETSSTTSDNFVTTVVTGATENLIRKMLPPIRFPKFSVARRRQPAVSTLESASLDDLIKAAVEKCLKYRAEEEAVGRVNETIAGLCDKLLTLNEIISTGTNNDDVDDDKMVEDKTTDNIILASSESIKGSVLENSEGAIILENPNNDNNDDGDNDNQAGEKNPSISGSSSIDDGNQLLTTANSIYGEQDTSSPSITDNNGNGSSTACHKCTWSVSSSGEENEANFLWAWMVVIVCLILLVTCNTILFSIVRCYKSNHQSKKLKIPLDSIGII